VVNAIFAANKAVREVGGAVVPPNLRDAHYKGSEELGHTGYKYAHDFPNHYVEQQYLPDAVKDMKFYEPGVLGHEKDIREYMDMIHGEEKSKQDT
jgi:putative ATPase